MALQTPAIPTVVASVCGHKLTGGDPPKGKTTIPAARITNCASCKPYIATACHHAVAVTTANIDRPSDQTLCLDCTAFINTSKKLLTARSKWETFASKPAPTQKGPEFGVYRSEWKSLYNEFRSARVEYANAAAYHREHDDPEFPTVNKRGAALLSRKSSVENIEDQSWRRSASTKSVSFDETENHPTRETGRHHLEFKRSVSVYVPGKYADRTGNSWLNTSDPTLNGFDYSAEFEEFMTPRREAPGVPRAVEGFGLEVLRRGAGAAPGKQDSISLAGAEGGEAQDVDESTKKRLNSNDFGGIQITEATDDWKEWDEHQKDQAAHESDSDISDNASEDLDDGTLNIDDGLEEHRKARRLYFEQCMKSHAIIDSLKRSRDDEQDEDWTLGEENVLPHRLQSGRYRIATGSKRPDDEEDESFLGDFQDEDDIFTIRFLSLKEPPPISATPKDPSRDDDFSMPASQK